MQPRTRANPYVANPAQPQDLAWAELLSMRRARMPVPVELALWHHAARQSQA